MRSNVFGIGIVGAALALAVGAGTVARSTDVEPTAHPACVMPSPDGSALQIPGATAHWRAL
jgi:hypothetical protein